jgi:hypothetical protein
MMFFPHRIYQRLILPRLLPKLSQLCQNRHLSDHLIGVTDITIFYLKHVVPQKTSLISAKKVVVPSASDTSANKQPAPPPPMPPKTPTPEPREPSREPSPDPEEDMGYRSGDQEGVYLLLCESVQ